jgi:hypothetical protein
MGSILDPPTEDDVNVGLRERAAKVGANAVINVTYRFEGRWGEKRPESIRAEGTAVIFECTCDDSPGVFLRDRCVECLGRVRPPSDV